MTGGAPEYLNEIATKSGLESNKCAKYLGSLSALGLVGKEYPFGETAGKRSVYKKALFAECKWKNAHVDTHVLHELANCFFIW